MTTTTTQYEPYRLRGDNQTHDLKFNGVLIAEASNQAIQGPQQHRYTVFYLYKTETEKYVMCQENVTNYPSEEDTNNLHVFRNLEAVKDHFLNSHIDDTPLPRWIKEFMTDCDIELVKEI